MADKKSKQEEKERKKARKEASKQDKQESKKQSKTDLWRDSRSKMSLDYVTVYPVAPAHMPHKPAPYKGSSDPEPKKQPPTADHFCVCRRTVDMERVAALARPNSRRLRSLWDEKAVYMPKERRDKIKSALEEDYFLSPEQTEQYFQALTEASRRAPYGGLMALSGAGKQENAARQRELQQRQKWLVNFSAQVAYRMCDYIAKGQRELLVSNRLRSIADVVLERVAEILGEPKPTRSHPGRLARFMVCISDRIAVWIENAVYRADALDFEPRETGKDEHVRLDEDEPVIC